MSVGPAQPAHVARQHDPGVLGTWTPDESIEGYSLVLSIPLWVDELLGQPFPVGVLREIQLIQGYLLIHLQHVDDAIDGQSQMGGGDAAPPVAEAERRLAKLFDRGHPFWNDYRRLAREQQRSRRWEASRRGMPLPRFDGRLRRSLTAKAALLRWPAVGMARLAGRPGLRRRLDELCARFIAVALLFDDLTDVEEDADEGRVNAVLCAGRISSRAPFHLYPRAIRGASIVCGWMRAELGRLAAQGVSSAGFVRVCHDLSVRCGELEQSFLRAYQVRLVQRMVEALSGVSTLSSR